MRRIILLLSLGVGLATAATSQETFNSVIERYSNLRSFSASFDQQICSKSTGTCQKLSGKFVYVSPNKFRLEVTKPLEELVVSDGQTFWIYLPTANQAIQTKPGPEQELFLFLGRFKNYAERYTVSLNSTDTFPEAHFSAKTTPDGGAHSAGFLPPDFILLIDASRKDIAGVRVNQGDTEITFFLEEIERDVVISAQDFTFSPPKGVTVIKDTGTGYQ